MKRLTRYLAALLAAVAIGGGFVLAPVALADAGTRPAVHSTAPSNPAPAPTSSDWPEYETGVDPMVPSNTGADPVIPLPYGQGRAF
jgi:hypothetical protein